MKFPIRASKSLKCLTCFKYLAIKLNFIQTFIEIMNLFKKKKTESILNYKREP